ncbi:lipopolysaccharide biosynthesis protein RfbH [Alphaproteobacteria bacterium]|nr:lipopolysaccharide biosynthesis protein RfbH [Alphaproteobacteria bacterium]
MPITKRSKLKEASLSDEDLRATILELTKEYSRRKHSNNGFGVSKFHFEEEISRIDYAARVFDEEEVAAAVSSTLDFWLTLGPEGHAMERELASYLGIRKSLLVNSGSSANLVAISTLTSPLVPGRRLMRGDEVITCAAGFPTTVSPIIQSGLVPVFVDNNPITGNIDVSQLEEAYDSTRTKAVMVAHTLGNPFDISSILSFCKKYDLWLIEDNCDALGSSYAMPFDQAVKIGRAKGKKPRSPSHKKKLISRYTGTWGDLSTQSFYPPHHMTMGEGGAVNISGSLKLRRPAESIRDWGRDCWCPSGQDNTCGHRFSRQFGNLPHGFDHKYTYSHIGYNLKPLDVQAAIGRIQLKKLPEFVRLRKENWSRLRFGLDELSNFFDFMLPTHAKKWKDGNFSWDNSGSRTDCSWFGFMLLVKEEAPFSSVDLARHLDSKQIGNRMLFGGNLVKQPAFVQLENDYDNAFRVVGSLKGADTLMQRAIFIGTYPGLSDRMIDYMIDVISDFVRSK